MKKDYISPATQLVELFVEGAILATSSEQVSNSTSTGEGFDNNTLWEGL